MIRLPRGNTSLRCDVPTAPALCSDPCCVRPTNYGEARPTRRGLLGGLAALALAGGTATAWAAPDAKPVVPGTKPAKATRIDVHHHFMPPPYILREHERGGGFGHNLTPAQISSWSPQKAIDILDANGIATAFGSVSTPGVWVPGKLDESRANAREWNDYSAKMIQDFPGRFGLFAPIPLPDTEGSLREIEYALETLKADGIGLLSNYEGKWLGDAAFDPVFAELNRRHATVYVHPTAAPCCVGIMPGFAPQMVEFPFDTVRTIASLVYSGTTTRYGNIRFIFSHAGGALPMLAARIAESGPKDMRKNVPGGVEAEFRRFWYDTASAANGPAMAALMNLVPLSQVLFGTDYPFVAPKDGIEGLAALHLPGTQLAAIEHGNAMKLLPRLQTRAHA